MADGITIATRENLGLFAIMARKGVDAAAIGAALLVEAPTHPAWTTNGALSLVGTGPGTWLLITENASPAFTGGLQQKLAGLASVSDQSGGYVIHRIAGRNARALLQRGVHLDMHPDVFKAGSAASTVIAHIGVILWQVDDEPTYDIATFRSYAHSFAHWIDVTAAAL